MKLLKSDKSKRAVRCKRCRKTFPKRKFQQRSRIYGGWICQACVKEVRKNIERRGIK